MRTLLLLGTIIIAALQMACAEPGPPERIVLVVVDTLRRDALGCYGGKAETPTIDRLAREGQLFPNAMASFHQTTMSMGALFTGRTPSLESGEMGRPIPFVGRTWCGLARFDPENRREQCVPGAVNTLAEHFRAAGYATIGLTSNSLLFEPYGLSRGFDDWTEVGDVPVAGTMMEIVASLGSRVSPKVNAAVEEALSRRSGDHFFLYVHYMDVHDYGMQEVAGGGPVEKLRGKYHQAVGEVDRAVAGLLDMLEERDLLEGSLVVFTSDHGERLRERHFIEGRANHTGNPSFEEVLEVPLVVWPARFEKSLETVKGTDLFAMLVGLVGLSGAPNAQLEADEVFTSELRWLTYRRGRWKSYTRRDERAMWLVDLRDDPLEKHDVAAENPEIAQRHWDRVTALAAGFAVPKGRAGAAPGQLSSRDEARLRALGYLPPADAAATDPAPADSGSARDEKVELSPRVNERAPAPGGEGWRPLGRSG